MSHFLPDTCQNDNIPLKSIFLILPLVFLFYCSVQCQTDSLTRAREVDSLIQMNRALVEQQKFDEALGILETAEKKAGNRSTVKKGYAATEETFKQLGKNEPSPRILHVATHGFFFPDPASSNPAKGGEPAFKVSDNPMIRSGLILAGANHAWKTGLPLANLEDGILTAYEISQLDLRHTDLVVLSACETGLGQIAGNEGVYGLQRAFKIAGAKNLVMSLWQVPDYQTQELMTIFYQKMLLENMPVQVALQAAQEEMRQRNYEPYYWAGFVLIE